MNHFHHYWSWHLQIPVQYICVSPPWCRLSISSEKLKHGTYKMQIDWKQGKSDFYTEGVVTIQ